MISVLTLNIGNPSLERAKKQVAWLEQRDEDIFLLTETKNSEGCNYIENYFKNYGYDLFSLNSTKQYYVFFPKSNTGDLGTMIISKIPFVSTFTVFEPNSIFYGRASGCQIKIEGKDYKFLSVYVPSRDASIEKINRKKEFCAGLATYLKEHELDVIGGDFNILERQHIPHYSNFLDFEYRFYEFMNNIKFIDAWKVKNEGQLEYSWVGRTNDGYRYDYFFVKDSIYSKIINCKFLHETRTTSKITDHSAVCLNLDL